MYRCVYMCIYVCVYIYIYIRLRGFPLNGIFGPCAGACWWLLGVVVVGSSRVGVMCRDHFGHLKLTNIDNIHKIHAPKFQGVFFSEVAEAPQAAATQTHSSGGR